MRGEASIARPASSSASAMRSRRRRARSRRVPWPDSESHSARVGARRCAGHSGAATVRRGIRVLRTRAARARLVCGTVAALCKGRSRRGGSTRPLLRGAVRWRRHRDSRLTGRPAASRTAAQIAPRRGIRKTRGRSDRVCYAGRESWVRPVTCARRCATESAALQIGSRVVPSHRCHNADPIPGWSPQRSIPDCRGGVRLTRSTRSRKTKN
jgi:hypothetical protein